MLRMPPALWSGSTATNIPRDILASLRACSEMTRLLFVLREMLEDPIVASLLGFAPTSQNFDFANRLAICFAQDDTKGEVLCSVRDDSLF